ncbi:MAG: hypothetical protein L6Q54_13225 [Leptospiraceae bacterium]|nr:hypothetical protein [Leptospiraceae bacterium]MCK6382196.1 hypothetical protein [Leptospiraceae bacterium]NUM42700.1 hypothetical protein [Leptospiraceae bacterium]
MGESDKVYSIRFIAKDEESGLNCLFCAIFDPVIGKFEQFEILLGSNVSISNPSQATFKDFSNSIQLSKYKGDFSKNYTNSLSENYKTGFLSESFIEELRHYLETSDNERLNYLFQQPQIQVLGATAKINMELFYEKIERNDIEKTNQVINTSADESNTGSQDIIPQGSMVVNFKFALSPVSGVKVSELKDGSRIMVKIVPGDTNSNNTINLLKLRDDGGNIKVIPATIVFINHTAKGTETIIKITDSIFGKYTEEEASIKVKLAGNETLASSVSTPQTETRKAPAIQPRQTKEDSGSLPIGVLIIIGALGIIGAFITIFLL